MSYILNIETSGPKCSVALTENGHSIGIKESNKNFDHASIITILIRQLLKETGVKLHNLDAISVSKGPGSYTGLRIGTSVAKGICTALDIPLIGVDTLKYMAHNLIHVYPDYNYFCPMIDARRMEVYTALYDKDLNEIIMPTAKILNVDFKNILVNFDQLIISGSGARKAGEFIENMKGVLIYNSDLLSAASMAERSFHLLQNKNYENLIYFEPFYLKPIIAD